MQKGEAETMDKINLIYKGTEPNHLCCESILREMPNGEWVAFIQSGGFSEPHVDNDIFASRSTDRGKTWGTLERLFDLPGKATYHTEVMVHGGEVTIFVTTHNGGFLDWEAWTSVSRDSGKTWSELQPLFEPSLRERTFIRNLFIKRNGEMLLPFQHYHVPEAELTELKAQNKKIMSSTQAQSENGVLISGDGGKTWSRHGGIFVKLNNWNWAENNLAELSDGTLVMLIRADRSGVLYRSDSVDGGRTWSEPYRTDIPNPGSKIRLLPLSDGRIALLHNPTPYDKTTKWMMHRNPMSLWISDDDMKSWRVKRDLVTFPGSLSYPDGFVDEQEGYIHFAFEYNRHDSIYVGAKIDQ
jgi:predicted neuraminidase